MVVRENWFEVLDGLCIFNVWGMILGVCAGDP
jgi:hypothetical protein